MLILKDCMEEIEKIMDRSEKKIGDRVSFYDIAFDGEYGWFCDVYTNTLCRINMDTACIAIEAMIPFDRDFGAFQYGFIAKKDNVLILAPRTAYTILLYSIEDKSFKKIQIDSGMLEGDNENNLFSGVKTYGNNTYLIPGRFPGIIKLNMVTAEVTYLREWYTVLKQEITDYDDLRVMFARCDCRKENKLYLPCWQSNKIMIFNLETEEYSFIELSSYEKNLSSVCIVDDELWISSRDSNVIIRTNREGKEIEKITIEGIESRGLAFIVKCGQIIYAVPVYDNYLIALDISSRVCQKVCNLVKEKVNMPQNLIFAKNNILSCVKDGEERIWMYSIFDGKIYRCDANGKVEILNSVLETQNDVNERNNYYFKMRIKEEIIQEDCMLGLEELLEYIQNEKI